ncbi:hypothetical protein SAMN05660668_02284 [Pseudobutyrivibrio sp. AR14]|uniref:hypothetical protein n=1 Tax=Pseudobutyrivibrio sp. AR14 TaxID=1520804 RepID=UPI000886A6A5|nr:hypothetical protein [Pseudobutyrivibrio sp. AR14]SCY34387.1 hypothetical protein SAMN05660668_02284 [Pseudobutyrivibrio sp. AR14]
MKKVDNATKYYLGFIVAASLVAIGGAIDMPSFFEGLLIGASIPIAVYCLWKYGVYQNEKKNKAKEDDATGMDNENA